MLKVSFYSYKGGSGRSTTSWNTIRSLIDLMHPTAKEPFIIVDTDVQSAGSTFLYRAKKAFYKKDDNNYKSVQWRLTNAIPDYSDSNDFFKGMWPVGIHFGLPDEEKNSVLLIGASLNKQAYANINFNDSRKLENFSDNITYACEDFGAKALFFDTPSGTQSLAELSIEDSDVIVCCMRPTSQFREGTRDQLISFIKGDIETKLKKYIITPTAVCIDGNQEFRIGGKNIEYPDEAKKDILLEFSTDYDDTLNDKEKQVFKDSVIFDMLEPTPDEIKKITGFDDLEVSDKIFGIPEVKRFKWFEQCLKRLPENELSPNDKMAINRYEYLAKLIIEHQPPKE